VRQLVSGELATFDKNELLGLAICLETDEMTAAEAASYIRARWLEGKSSSGLATYPTATHRAVSVEAIRRMVAAIGQWSPLPLMTLSENEAYRIAYHFAEDCGALPRLTPDHDTQETP
jgi:hypothetical protein